MPEGDDTRWRDPVGALFSTAATDNAEVVPEQVARGPEDMWSTAANVPPAEPEEAVEGELVDDPAEPAGPRGANGHAGHPRNGFAPGPPPTGGVNGSTNGAASRGAYGEPPPGSWGTNGTPHQPGGVFSAEPVRRPDDVIEEDGADTELDAERAVLADQARLWSAGEAARPSTTQGTPLFAKGRAQPEPPDPWSSTDGDDRATPPPSPFAAEVVAPRRNGAPAQPGPQVNGTVSHVRRTPPPPPRVEVGLDGRLTSEDAADPNGLRAVISHLPPSELQRAAVPIAVCGALLQRNERVLGAVTGQMLGRPAVVVVTGTRVLVVNDRRFQPIVDEFKIDASLVVRGRHDRNVAALSFADAERLALVDGISEVSLAIELAERIRQVGTA